MKTNILEINKNSKRTSERFQQLVRSCIEGGEKGEKRKPCSIYKRVLPIELTACLVQ